MRVICISGKAQHGKTTTAEALLEYYNVKHPEKKVLFVNYGDLLKYIAKAFFNWNGEKDEAGRTLLQTLGDKFRGYDKDYFVKFVIDVLKANKDEWDIVLIGDCRFRNEIDLMYENFDARSVRIDRGDFTGGLTKEQRAHISETALDDYSFDYVIKNDAPNAFELISEVLDLAEDLIAPNTDKVICAKCGSDIIEYSYNVSGEDSIYSRCECMDCGEAHTVNHFGKIMSKREFLNIAKSNGWLKECICISRSSDI